MHFIRREHDKISINSKTEKENRLFHTKYFAMQYVENQKLFNVHLLKLNVPFYTFCASISIWKLAECFRWSIRNKNWLL